MNNLGLGFVFTARDLASGKMHELNSNFGRLNAGVDAATARMTRNFQRLGHGLGVMAAGGALLGGAWVLVSYAGKFEQTMAGIGSVMKASTEEMKLLHDAAIAAGLATQFSPQEAAEGLQNLATAGQTAREATQTLIPVLDLAAGSLGQLGVAEAANAVVGTLKAYQMEATRSTEVTDKLLRITQLTNFQARDFEAGLAKAAATGATFGQSLDDTLISVGLLRNMNIDASSSATSYREAVRRLGSDLHAQAAITGKGIDIYDRQTGAMRPVVDIMQDLAEKSVNWTEAERNRVVAQAFGARGLMMFNAVSKTTFTTMRDGQQVTLQGREALAEYRRQMGEAGGTAAMFRERLLDTFEGQKTLLQGTLQTWGVVLGEPFARAFKPIVGAVNDTFVAVLEIFQKVPDPIKNVMAKVVVGLGAFLTAVGGLIALKATFGILTGVMAMFGMTWTGLMLSMLPAIGVLTMLVVGTYAVKKAFDANLGGIADTATRVWDTLRIVFGSIAELITEGVISGPMRAELEKAGNEGMFRFVERVSEYLARLQALWEGTSESFGVMATLLATPLLRIQGAFSRIFAMFGGPAAEASGTMLDWQEAGYKVGVVLYWVARAFAEVGAWIAEALEVGARFTAGLLGGLVPGFQAAGDSTGFLWDSLRGLWRTLKETMTLIFGASDGTRTWGDAAQTAGRWLGVAAGYVAGLVTWLAGGLARALELVTDLFGGVWVGLEAMFGPIAEAGAVIGNSFGLLWQEIVKLGEAVGLVSAGGGDAAGSWETVRRVFGALGVAIGAIVGGVAVVVEYLVVGAGLALTGVVRVIRWLSESFRDHFEAVPRFWSGVWNSVVGFFVGVGEVFASIGGGIVDVFLFIGNIVRNVIDTVGLVFGLAYDIITLPFRNAWVFLKALFTGASLKDAFMAVLDNFVAIGDRLIAYIGRLVSRIPSAFRPGFLDTLVEAGQAAEARQMAREGGLSGLSTTVVAPPPSLTAGMQAGALTSAQRSQIASMSETDRRAMAAQWQAAQPRTAAAAPGGMTIVRPAPAAAATTLAATPVAPVASAVVAGGGVVPAAPSAAEIGQAVSGALRRDGAIQVQTRVEMDGQRVGEAVGRAQAADRAASFAPAPTGVS